MSQDYIEVWDQATRQWIRVPVSSGQDHSRPAPEPQPSGKTIYDELGRETGYTEGSEW